MNISEYFSDDGTRNNVDTVSADHIIPCKLNIKSCTLQQWPLPSRHSFACDCESRRSEWERARVQGTDDDQEGAGFVQTVGHTARRHSACGDSTQMYCTCQLLYLLRSSFNPMNRSSCYTLWRATPPVIMWATASTLLSPFLALRLYPWHLPSHFSSTRPIVLFLSHGWSVPFSPSSLFFVLLRLGLSCFIFCFYSLPAASLPLFLLLFYSR